jgi:hypothetical protein
VSIIDDIINNIYFITGQESVQFVGDVLNFELIACMGRSLDLKLAIAIKIGFFYFF